MAMLEVSINPREDFSGWLSAHGVSARAVEAVDAELGVADYESFLACAEQPQIRAEFLSAAKQRLPFAFYAAVRRATEALLTKRRERSSRFSLLPGSHSGPPLQPFLSGLLEAIVLMLSTLSQELQQSAERFSCLEPALYMDTLEDPDAGTCSNAAEEYETLADPCMTEDSQDAHEENMEALLEPGPTRIFVKRDDSLPRGMASPQERAPGPARLSPALEVTLGDIKTPEALVEVKVEKDDISRDDSFGGSPIDEMFDGVAQCGDLNNGDEHDNPVRRAWNLDAEAGVIIHVDDIKSKEARSLSMNVESAVTQCGAQEEPRGNAGCSASSLGHDDASSWSVRKDSRQGLRGPSLGGGVLPRACESGGHYASSAHITNATTATAQPLQQHHAGPRREDGKRKTCTISGIYQQNVALINCFRNGRIAANDSAAPLADMEASVIRPHFQTDAEIIDARSLNMNSASGSAIQNCIKRLKVTAPHIQNACREAGEKPYQCKVCGQKFRDLQYFRKHERIHAGEVLFACEQCGKVFLQSFDLIRHKRIHTGEKPFACAECGMAFRLKHHLVGHQQRHTRDKDRILAHANLESLPPSSVIHTADI
ncbi:uncharacterized protein LOC116944065 isoform X1 [Petromyzon marinus]|uniref:uncharacterized protein LOC116944065 isoform X1 n=1 Tax=Petromyzon marinus TaxID=7757 RepID=UPI003F6EFCD5